MRVIIDRFEDEYAVVELPNKKTEVIKKTLLPPKAEVGDVIEITINKRMTLERAKTIQSKFDKLKF